MLGWVAAVSATESPSQLKPGVDPEDVDDGLVRRGFGRSSRAASRGRPAARARFASSVVYARARVPVNECRCAPFDRAGHAALSGGDAAVRRHRRRPRVVRAVPPGLGSRRRVPAGALVPGAIGRRARRTPWTGPSATRSAVHYFPGMWSWDRGDRRAARASPPTSAPAARTGGRPCSARYPRVGGRRRPVHAAARRDRHRRARTRSRAARHATWPTRTAHAVRYRDRIDLVLVDDDDDDYWLGEHRVVRRVRATTTSSRSTSAAVLRVLGVGRDRARDDRSPGVQYTELRARPAGVPADRACAHRRREGRARRTGSARRSLGDARRRPSWSNRTPTWAHCARCDVPRARASR